jgi:hypothetical protein
MHHSRPYFYNPIVVLALLLFSSIVATAQQITGVWNGRIDGRKVELKIIQKGDSLTGTAYYFEAPQRYRQYCIRGYFDAIDNSVVWWDEALLQQKGLALLRGEEAFLSVADFNCPGGGRMFLDGAATEKAAPDVTKGAVHLTKTGQPLFPDVWDYVIDNYMQGTSDPEVIDSIALIAFAPVEKPAAPAIKTAAPPELGMPPVSVAAPRTIEQKFRERQKTFTMEIPVAGDSIELRFYDNAQVDGDSISLFLNNQMFFQHVRLTEQAYTIKIPTTAFDDTAELVMVAENLGSIPPNTSFMVALSGGQRYEARLASTENSSAYIRLKKAAPVEDKKSL